LPGIGRLKAEETAAQGREEARNSRARVRAALTEQQRVEMHKSATQVLVRHTPEAWTEPTQTNDD
jgi:hypothetical protein